MKFSVIIPCYNVEKYIDDCLESIINQTIGLKNLEIILVDDCSTDNTVEILKQYEQKYSENIILILSEKNGKQGTARNIGLSYATGDFISFVDSDDWIRKDMYEVLSNIISKTGCDIVQFQFTENAKDLNLTQNEKEICYSEYIINSVEARRRIILNSEIYNESCCRKVYRRDIVIRSNAYFAEGVSYEEPLFTYPIKFFVEKICVIKEALYYYRYNENGTTVSYMQKPSRILEHLAVQLDVYNLMKNTHFYNDFKEEIDLYFIHTYYCEQFYFLKYRELHMPLALFKYSVMNLESNLPNWKDNKYLNDSAMKEEKELLYLIDKIKGLTDTEAQVLLQKTQNSLIE